MEENIPHSDEHVMHSSSEQANNLSSPPNHEITEQTAKLIEDKHGNTEKPFGLYIIRPGTPEWQIAKEFEKEKFYEYFGNDPELMEREYEQYDAHSVFLLVVDNQQKKPVGEMRLIQHSPEKGMSSFKSLVDLQEEPWNTPIDRIEEYFSHKVSGFRPQNIWDVATFAISEEYRKKDNQGKREQVSYAMFYALYNLCLQRGVDLWVAIMDDRAIRSLDGIGGPYDRYDDLNLGSASYLDSPASTPIYGVISESKARVVKFDESIGAGGILVKTLEKGDMLRPSFDLPDELNDKK